MRVSLPTLLIAATLALSACQSSEIAPVVQRPSGPTEHVASVGVLAALGAYNVDSSKTTVSGISSGGFMAVQLHVAYSRTFHNAAIYAGGPYYCAAGSLTTAQNTCQYATASSLASSEAYLDRQSAAGTIDNESNLSGEKAYLWSGTSDYTVYPKTMDDLAAEYKHYGVATTYVNTYPAGHGWESLNGEVACGTSASPYMIDCSNYDSQKVWLTAFFGALNPRNAGALAGTLVNFDQTPFGGGANDLDTNGYLFVPTSCAQGRPCKLVVALDGCVQTQASIGTKFVREAGLNEYADTNDMLVLYPYQVSSSTPSNPNGCWDWFGYGSSNYALRTGPQMVAIKKMVDRIQSGSSATPTPTPTVTPSPGTTPTPTPVATPTPLATATPVATSTPTPACFSGSNYSHVVAGRAHDGGGYALANGSNANMGLDNVYYTTTLKRTGANYYVIGCP